MSRAGQITLEASAAKTATFQTSGRRVMGFTKATVYSIVSAVSGGGTIDVAVEVSPDNSNWGKLNVTPDITEDVVCAQQTAATVEAVTFPLASRFIRCNCTVSGTSVTLSIVLDLVDES
jgi:carbon monoxide dehydrogenase subunit G|tara:strand:+ start:7569 stop:7925 length:357 start_codon:yes stop_codon:yes gene_type:complete